jgi:hypothetical protein
MLAGAERVGGKVRTSAGTITQLAATHGDPIGRLALWIGDFKLGKNAIVADVLEKKILRAAELATKFDLPVLE